MATMYRYRDRQYWSVDELRERAAEIKAKYAGQTMPAGAKEEWDTLNEWADEITQREDRLREAARSPRNIERGDGAKAYPTKGAVTDERHPQIREAQSLGLRAIERHQTVLTTDASDSLEELVRERDPMGLGSRYLDAVGDPNYFSAFGKLLADPMMGHNRFTSAETAAVQKVTAVEFQRGMVEGTGSAGGFGVPFQLDPTILLSSTGALNPLRSISRLIQVTTTPWKGVSSDGVTASYDAEASEVSDDTPVLAQPQIDVRMGRAFVPFSMEVGDDWAGLSSELQKLISDARDVLDASKFILGVPGSNEPCGILNIGGTGSLSTTQRVQTAGSATYAVGDPWLLKAQLPPRFLANTTYAAAPAIWDKTYRFVAQGSTTEPRQFGDGDRGGNFLGAPKIEVSTMVTTTTTASRIVIAGDFRAGYTIADRLGMTAEIVPFLFGASRRPTGERGLFARWRTGAAVVVPNALRYLEVL